MSYTNKEIVKIVEIAKKKKKELTHVTDKSRLTTEDKVKLGLCKHFVQFVNERRSTLTQISNLIDLPVSRLSEMGNYKIGKFTVDQLLANLELLAKHDPKIREYLKFFGEAAEMPTLSVNKTKQLTRDIKEAALQL